MLLVLFVIVSLFVPNSKQRIAKQGKVHLQEQTNKNTPHVTPAIISVKW